MLDLIGTTKSLYSTTKTAVQCRAVPCRAYKKRSNKTRAVRHTKTEPTLWLFASKSHEDTCTVPCQTNTKAKPTSPRSSTHKSGAHEPTN